MPLILSSSINLTGAVSAPTIIIQNGGGGIVSSSQQIQNYNLFAVTSSASTTFYGNVTASGNLQTNQLYVGGATTSTGLIGASEAVVQNELGIQFGDATGTYMRLIANGANSNTAIQAGAFSGADPSLDLISAGGSTAISIKSYAGVNFGGAITASAASFSQNVGIGTASTGAILRRLNIKSATDTPQLYLVQSNNDAGGWMTRAGVDGHYHLISYQGSESEKLTVQYDTANVGINTPNPDVKLHVSGSDGIKIQAGGNADTPGLTIINYTNQYAWAKFGGGLQGNGKGYATISNWNGSSLNETIRISGDGYLRFPSGGGVQFNGATAAANSLDDYEEGTWTPTIRGANTAGTYELTHVSHYTKIGRQVTLTSRINMAGSITGGGVGYMQIQGLPYAKGENIYAIGACDVIGCDTTGNYLTVQFISLGAGSTLFLSETNDNATSTDFPISGLSASDSIGISITYFTA